MHMHHKGEKVSPPPTQYRVGDPVIVKMCKHGKKKYLGFIVQKIYKAVYGIIICDSKVGCGDILLMDDSLLEQYNDQI